MDWLLGPESKWQFDPPISEKRFHPSFLLFAPLSATLNSPLLSAATLIISLGLGCRRGGIKGIGTFLVSYLLLSNIIDMSITYVPSKPILNL